MTNVFISYNKADSGVAKRLSDALEAQGLSVFRDVGSLVAGQEFSQQIADTISQADAVIVLLSGNSKRSTWVEHELAVALEHEKMVVPVLLDSDAKNNWIWPLVYDRMTVTLDKHKNFSALAEELVSVADLERAARRLNIKHVDQIAEHVTDRHDTEIDWRKQRKTCYDERRYINLVHALEPSQRPNQEFDILIYLFRHRPKGQSSPYGLDDVIKAEFFLGQHWGNRVFECKNDGNRYIGIKVSAHGSFLCLCRVTFDDRDSIMIDRYIDFEGQRPSVILPA